MQSKVREYVCPQFGHQSIRTLSVLETRVNGSWVFAYLDYPDTHEYGVKIMPNVLDGIAITMWFTDPMARKNFMLTVDTDEKMEQLNNGMVFNHLNGRETHGKFTKFVRRFFRVDR